MSLDELEGRLRGALVAVVAARAAVAGVIGEECGRTALRDAGGNVVAVWRQETAEPDKADGSAPAAKVKRAAPRKRGVSIADRILSLAKPGEAFTQVQMTGLLQSEGHLEPGKDCSAALSNMLRDRRLIPGRDAAGRRTYVKVRPQADLLKAVHQEIEAKENGKGEGA